MGVKGKSALKRPAREQQLIESETRTHLCFQLGVFRFKRIPIAVEFLHLGLKQMQFIVGDFQLFLGAVNVEQWRDTNEKSPPGPIAHLHEGADISLDASHGQFLESHTIRNSPRDGDKVDVVLPGHVAVRLVVAPNIRDRMPAIV